MSTDASKRAFRPTQLPAPEYPEHAALRPETTRSRRSFLTLVGASLGGLALLVSPFRAEAGTSRRRPPKGKQPPKGGKGKGGNKPPKKRKKPPRKKKKPPVHFDGVAFMKPAPIDIEG